MSMLFGVAHVTKKRVVLGADDEIRTRDPHLGKVMLYQLSHVRKLTDWSLAEGLQ